jgi:translocation and assembly module TamB
MSEPTTPPVPPQAPPAASPRRRRRLLLAAALVIGAIAAGAASFATWLWRSTAGLEFALATVNRLTPIRLIAQGASGSLADGFAFSQFTYDSPKVTVTLDGMAVRIADLQVGLSLAALRIDLAELTAERLKVAVRPSDKPSSALPESIASPVRVSAKRLAVGTFELETGAGATVSRLALRSIEGDVAIGPEGYRVAGGRLGVGPRGGGIDADFEGSLNGGQPFAIDVRGQLRGQVRAAGSSKAQAKAGAITSVPLQAAFAATGSLVRLTLDANVQPQAAAAPGAMNPRGTARAQITSFEAPYVRELIADLKDIDPAAWIAGAPQARLDVHAELKPVAGTGFAARGPVRVSNAAPGTIDAGRLPVRQVSAKVEASADALRISDAVVDLVRGSARGGFEMAFARVDQWHAQAAFAGIDPSTLHGRLRSAAVDGRADVNHAAGDTWVRGQARSMRGPPLSADFDLRANAARVRITTALVRLGSGSARVSGEIRLAGGGASRIEGTLADFDPSLLAPEFPARLNGSFLVDGVIEPTPSGTLQLALVNSEALGRPLAGRALASLDGRGRLEVDADIKVADASLTARGGLGDDSRSLNIALQVPSLKALGLPLSGRAVARARLAGELRAPAVDTTIELFQLQFDQHRIDEMQAVGTYSGGTDGVVSIQASAANHRFIRNPMLSLQTVTLRADGRLRDHRIELRANNEQAQPVNALLVGGWTTEPLPGAAAGRSATASRPTRAEWRGELRSAEAGRPLELALRAPAQIRTNFSDWSIGPVDLDLAGARVEQIRLDLADGVFSTSGRFTDFRPSTLRGASGNLIPATERLTAASGASRPGPIALSGNWQLRLGAQADGSVLIERTGGDIDAGGTAMGIKEVRFAATLKANKLQATARMNGVRAGRIEADLSAEVEPTENGWRIAQQRPLAARAEADLPSIAWINALLSEAVRANVRLGGSATARIVVEGTPESPRAQGTMNGENLRVAWIDQGVRLENGKLVGRVDGGTIILDELRFSGKPQVAPAGRRVRDYIAREGLSDEGFVEMNGQLELRSLSGVLQVRAVSMPFLQRADRWVRASGGANIVFDQRRVQLNGAVAANAGYIDFSRPNLPSLSSDVQVIRSNDAPPAQRESPIGLNLDLGIDLGPAFYLHGMGLDSRIDGQLRLRAEGPTSIRATGVVEARDGVFEGFGQKLAIERGRVNFQGPLDNPGLDILAVRRGLPVEVGVSVTRSAQNPLIRLYSDQSLPEFQTLSWLVLGRQADESGQDRAALATAALGLLSGTGEGIGTQLTQRLGIDEISLRSGEMSSAGSILPRSSVAGNVRGTTSGTSGEIITVGKRLSENITVSYEQALGGAASLVQVSYQLTRRLSVMARAGTENAIDLVYTFTFD